MNSLLEILKNWSNNTDSRAKLQQAYVATAFILLVIAGIVGLVNYDLGQRILLLALVAGCIFIINSIAWALLQSFILLHIDISYQAKKKTSNDVEELTDNTISKTASKSSKSGAKPTAKTTRQ